MVKKQHGMKILLAALISLVLAAPAAAGLNPDPHPSAKGKKVTYVSYTFRTVMTGKIGNVTISVPLVCYVPAKRSSYCMIAK